MGIAVDEFGTPYRTIEIIDDKTDGQTIRDGSITTEKIDSNFVSKVEIVSQAGIISMWSMTTPPDGWLICDGSAVSRAEYPNLFAVIGAYYGAGDGVNTFNIPDARGRVLVGTDGSFEFPSVGSKYGTKTHTLVQSELPSHDHSLNDPGHTHFTDAAAIATAGVQGGVGVNALIAGAGNATALNNTTGITISPVGGDQPHNNIQPSLCIHYIIKY